MKDLAKKVSENDKKMMELLKTPDEMRTFIRYGEEVSYLTTSIMAQFVHHATEHRAQAIAALEFRGFNAPSLDDYDLWSYEYSTK